jgi:uncharacterized membrane protein YbhN (UPF0104 family)
MKKVFLTIVWLIILAGLVYYLVSHSDELGKIIDLSAANISLLAVLFLATQMLNGAEIMTLMKAGDIRLKFWECFRLANISTAANYLPLKGGMMARAVYLKKRHDLSYMDFADLTVAGMLLAAMTIFASGAVFITGSYLLKGTFYKGLFIIFISLFFVFFVLTVLLRALNGKLKWKKLDQLGNGLRVILGKKSIFARLIAINLLAVIVMGLRFFVSFRALSFSAPFLLSVLCGEVKKVTTIIGLVPSGLGISEISAGAISGAMKDGLDIGVFAASLDRVVSVAVLLAAGTYSFYYLAKTRKKVEHE